MSQCLGEDEGSPWALLSPWPWEGVRKEEEGVGPHVTTLTLGSTFKAHINIRNVKVGVSANPVTSMKCHCAFVCTQQWTFRRKRAVSAD